MARSYGRVAVTRWLDPSWRSLSAMAQWCYVALDSQPKLSLAGVVDIKLGSWASWSSDLDQEDIRLLLDELEDAGWIAIDWVTEELLVIHHVRDDDLLKNSNLGKGMWNQLAAIESDQLQLCLIDNLPDEAWDPRHEPPFPTRENHRSNHRSNHGPEGGREGGSNYLKRKPQPVTGTAAAASSSSNGIHDLGKTG